MKIMKIPSTKSQIPNKFKCSKFKTDKMTARHRISHRNVLVIGTWNFDIVWNLSTVIWDFGAVSGKYNRFYLSLPPNEYTPPGMYLWPLQCNPRGRLQA
jgi:hypothetical protein